MSDDDELLRRWRDGESAAGAQLIERHLEPVHRFFSNKVAHATDDLVQKTFLACVESIAGFEGRASFRSYLFAIARNVLFRHYRDAHHDFDPLTLSAGSVIDQQVSPADRVADREEQRLLLRALRSLPLDLQVLLELAYWEGLSDVELAAVVEIPAGTIKSRLRKARMLLDEQLTTMAGSPALLESSRRTLEAWAAEIRDLTGVDGGGHRR